MRVCPGPAGITSNRWVIQMGDFRRTRRLCLLTQADEILTTEAQRSKPGRSRRRSRRSCSPCMVAIVASWTRVSACNLCSSEVMCVLMVLGETKSASAIALFVRPSATRTSTSRSRALSLSASCRAADNGTGTREGAMSAPVSAASASSRRSAMERARTAAAAEAAWRSSARRSAARAIVAPSEGGQGRSVTPRQGQCSACIAPGQVKTRLLPAGASVDGMMGDPLAILI